jgi:hypothetical protein
VRPLERLITSDAEDPGARPMDANTTSRGVRAMQHRKKYIENTRSGVLQLSAGHECMCWLPGQQAHQSGHQGIPAARRTAQS